MMRDIDGKVASPIMDDSITDLTVISTKHRNAIVFDEPVKLITHNEKS
jgi:hypothetical protein